MLENLKMSELEKLTNENEELKKAIGVLNLSNDGYVREIARLKQKIKSLEDDIKALEQRNNI